MFLLGGCKSHKNVEIAEFVATIIFLLEPKYGSSYILHSNIHVEVGNWNGVQYSQIEVDKMTKFMW